MPVAMPRQTICRLSFTNSAPKDDSGVVNFYEYVSNPWLDSNLQVGRRNRGNTTEISRINILTWKAEARNESFYFPIKIIKTNNVFMAYNILPGNSCRDKIWVNVLFKLIQLSGLCYANTGGLVNRSGLRVSWGSGDHLSSRASTFM